MIGDRANRDSAMTGNWRVLFRVLLKAAGLLLLCNVAFAWLWPMEALGSISLYNWLLPGRERLPYGENPAESYNLSLFSVPAMFHSHRINQLAADDEFRVLVIGDSGTWGWLLKPEDTLAGQLNAAKLVLSDGRRIVAYNLGYPIMALTKDLMLLEEGLAYGPDMVVWPVTLESFPREKQLVPPLLQNNPERVRRLVAAYQLNLNPADERFVEPGFLARTIFGQRRPLADLLRLQQYGFSWAATGIDQTIPAEIQLRQSDFEADAGWQEYDQPVRLGDEDLAFDVLAAGISMAQPLPVLLINEPMYVSSGQNSDLRYNSFYPRWAYDAYREMLGRKAAAEGWSYLDLWDAIDAEAFTDTPVHLTPAGSARLAEIIGPAIIDLTRSPR
jgi:hypothetical protein